VTVHIPAIVNETAAGKAGRPGIPGGQGKEFEIDPKLASEARIVALRGCSPQAIT
jgi:hypothetical protein